MIKLKSLILESEEDYRGVHRPSDKEHGASLDNITGIYPDDIYSNDAVRLYGSGRGDRGDISDCVAISIIQRARGKPDYKVRVYRAVPDINKEINDKFKYYSNLIGYFLKFGFPPPKDREASALFNRLDYNKEEFKSNIYAKMDKLNAGRKNKIEINNGDWVTLTKEYAIEHGESALYGKYKIISKVVSAKELFTTGDSIQEWGYANS